MTPHSHTWVLLRGLTREQGHWGDFPARLSAALPPGSVVLTPDIAGNGARCGEPSPATVAGLLDDVRAQLQVGNGPLRVVAMSLGAMMAAHWAHQYPHELHSAVLINTSLRPFSHFWQRLRPRQYPRILRLLLTQPEPAMWEQTILQMTSRHTPQTQTVLSQWVALREQHPVSTSNAWAQLRAAIGYRAPIDAPSVPLLLLNGLGDQLVHPDCSAQLAQAWHCPLLRHPTAGHDLPLDDPQWVIQQVTGWQPRA
ncbi:MAG: alpha/beta fold hydrolase [Aquabacterium sp.]